MTRGQTLANLLNSFSKTHPERGQANRHYKPGGGATVILALARESKSTFIGCSSQQAKAPMLSWSSPPLWIDRSMSNARSVSAHPGHHIPGGESGRGLCCHNCGDVHPLQPPIRKAFRAPGAMVATVRWPRAASLEPAPGPLRTDSNTASPLACKSERVILSASPPSTAIIDSCPRARRLSRIEPGRAPPVEIFCEFATGPF